MALTWPCALAVLSAWKKKNQKLQVASPGFEPAPQRPPAKKVRPQTTRPCGHCAMCGVKCGEIPLKYFSLPFKLFEPCGTVFIMNSKTHLRKNSLNENFKAVLHHFRGFLAALAEVHVAVLSVLNLPRQGFPSTCQIGYCCVCSPLLSASEILCDSPGDWSKKVQ